MIENLTTNLETAIQSAPLVAIAISLAAGIVTSFTPCVYPLIPITIGFIGAKGSTTKLRGFYLSLMYVLGLAIVYSALGAFAALTGKFFGQIQTNPWMHVVVANMCIIFGLAMLDVYNHRIYLVFPIRQSQNRGQRGSHRLTHRWIISTHLRPLHGACSCNPPHLCRDKAKCPVRYKYALLLCTRDGISPHYNWNLYRPYLLSAPVRSVDGQNKKGVRFFDDCCR